MVSDLLPDESIEALSTLYFARMHPLIPLLNEEDYWQALLQGTIQTPLVHVVCLLAAKDSHAEQHLMLLDSGDALVPRRDFCSKLYTSLSTALSQRSTMKKLTLVRILGLLSLHHEEDIGTEQASSHLARAANNAHALALHLPHPDDVDCELKRTFWCLWTLDRLNSATTSAPCCISDLDISVPELMPGESGFTAFDVLCRVAKVLNTVIDPKLHAPHYGGSGCEPDLPEFEQVIDEAKAWQLSQPTAGSS